MNRLMTYYQLVNCVIIASGNGLVPVWHQAIAWSNDDIKNSNHKANIIN